MREDTEAIIFDFGGVLINLDYDKTKSGLEALLQQPLDSGFSKKYQTEIFDKYETGNLGTQDFINLLLEKMKKDTTANAVVLAWNSMLLSIAVENIQFISSIKPKYKVYMLSNTNELHIDLAFSRWKESTGDNPYDLFDKVYLSHELGMRKPNAEIFDFVCNDIGISPEKILFIDDSEQHIDGANKLGLQTHLLRDINRLQEVLS